MVSLPLEQPIPVKMPPTHFEHFAKNKGLKIKKKVFDEATSK
jgi:hypothetical protein